MNADQALIGDEAPPRIAQALAEVHVLATLEGLIEAADGFERLTPDNEVAAAEPADVRAPNGATAQRAVRALHPCAVVGRDI